MGRAIHQYHHQCSTTRGGGGRDGTAPGRRAAFLFFISQTKINNVERS